MNSKSGQTASASKISNKSAKVAVLLLSMVAAFWSPYIGAAMDVILPRITSSMQLSTNSYSGILLGGTMAAALCYLPIGNLSDRFGRKRLLFWGIIVTTFSMLLSGFAQSSWALILGSVLLSVGGAVLYVNSMALACSVFERHAVGKVIGLISAAIYAGRMLGPVVAGFISDHLSWRWLFLLSALLGLILLILLTQTEEKKPQPTGETFDWQGVCISSLAIVGCIYGFSTISSNLANVAFAIAGIILLIVFVLWEQRAKNPILPLKLFKQNRKLSFTLITIIFAYTATYGIGSLGSLYLQYAGGISTQYTGVLLAILPLMQMVFSPVAGRAVDALQPRIISTLGLCGVVVGLAILLFINPQTPILLFAIALAILGICLAFISTPNTQAVMTSIDKEYLSLGSGLVGEFRNIGESFSVGIVNIILVMQIGYHFAGPEIGSQLTKTFHLVVVLFLVIAIIGAVCSYLRGK